MSIIKATINLRPATKADFVDSNNNYRFGRLYFLRSGKTGQFDTTPYYLTKDTNKKQLAEYKRFNQLFVPCGFFDDPNVEIEIIETATA